MNASEDALQPHDAARALRSLASFDDRLRQRMEGVLWMVLGLVEAGLFVTYAFAVVSDVPLGALVFLWVPWVLAGGAVVWGLRRGLALSTAAPDARGFAWMLGGFGLMSFLVGGGIIVIGSEAAPALALVAFSALATLPALAPSLGFTATTRRVGLAVGAVGVAAGALALASGSGALATWLGAAAGFAWLAGGVYATLEG